MRTNEIVYIRKESLKCHACLSFVIKMRKMTKLRQTLQITHFDVIRALRYSTPTGLAWNTNMAAVSLFWNTNMAAVTSCENAL